ncbi:MAG: TetR/AcrR family transcriptional regulator [Ilumatobacteraceae bacterium]
MRRTSRPIRSPRCTCRGVSRPASTAAGSPTEGGTVALLTRARIVAEARRMVESNGYEQVSLRGLAATLDVTAPALYDHVASKDDVLQSVAALGYEALGTSYDTPGRRAIDRVRERALAYVAFARDNPEMFRLMFTFRPKAVAIEVDNELTAATRVFDAAVEDVAQAIADGDMVERDMNQLGLTLWAPMHGVATIATTAPPVAEAVAVDVIDALLSGLRPRDTA